MPASSLRLIFMGTPDFAVPALQALIDARYEVVSVYSQPPKPAGRGQDLQKSPVQLTAEKHGIPVRAPASLKDRSHQQEFAALQPDVAVVAAYGLILPTEILQVPKYGCINIHASLLPRWRGAAPIQRAILEGDADTGISLMQMDEGLDTGPVYVQRTVPITTLTTASFLHDELAKLGAVMITEALPFIVSGALKATPQPQEGFSYAGKLSREEGRIAWGEPAAYLERMVRALNPWPGVFFDTKAGRIKVLVAELALEAEGEPGTLLDKDFTVTCGEDALRLTRVQREGRDATGGADFLRGFGLKIGEKIGNM